MSEINCVRAWVGGWVGGCNVVGMVSHPELLVVVCGGGWTCHLDMNKCERNTLPVCVRACVCVCVCVVGMVSLVRWGWLLWMEVGGRTS